MGVMAGVGEAVALAVAAAVGALVANGHEIGTFIRVHSRLFVV